MNQIIPLSVNDLYVLLTGRLLAFSCLIFLGGMIWRVKRLLDLFDRKDPHVALGFRTTWALKSVVHFLLPWSVTFREEKTVMVFSYLLHFSFLGLGFFAAGHAELIDLSWGLSWPSLPTWAADLCALAFLASAAFFMGRRMLVAYMQPLTGVGDVLAWALAAAPVITGYMARAAWMDPELWTMLHVLSGNALLVAAPFTKLAHMVTFFVSRAVTGSDFGKREVGAW